MKYILTIKSVESQGEEIFGDQEAEILKLKIRRGFNLMEGNT